MQKNISLYTLSYQCKNFVYPGSYSFQVLKYVGMNRIPEYPDNRYHH